MGPWKMALRLALAAALGASFISTAVAGPIGDIPSNRIPPNGWHNLAWEDPGGWTTITVTSTSLPVSQRIPANDSSVDASAKIQAILAATSGRRILYFPAGTYYFKTHLKITVGDIQLVGAGNDATFFNQQQTTNPGCIEFSGSTASGDVVTPGDLTGTISLTSAPALGAQTITLSNASSISVGDVIDVFQDFTPEIAADTWAREAWGQQVEVTAKSGNTLTLDMKLGLPYSAAKNPRVRKILPLRNIQIKDLHLSRTVDNNTVQAVLFRYVDNAIVYRVKSWKGSDRAHIYINPPGELPSPVAASTALGRPRAAATPTASWRLRTPRTSRSSITGSAVFATTSCCSQAPTTL